MKKNILICMVVGISFLLSACYFTSVHPLSSSATVDQNLLGLWKSLPKKNEKTETNYLLFAKSADNLLKVIILEHGYDLSDEYLGSTTSIADRNFISAQSIQMKNGKPELADDGYFLAYYRVIDRKRLEITLLNQDLIRNAITQGKVKGEVIAAKWGDQIQLTDSPENLARFIAAQKSEDLLDKESLVTAERVDVIPAP